MHGNSECHLGEARTLGETVARATGGYRLLPLGIWLCLLGAVGLLSAEANAGERSVATRQEVAMPPGAVGAVRAVTRALRPNMRRNPEIITLSGSIPRLHSLALRAAGGAGETSGEGAVTLIESIGAEIRSALRDLRAGDDPSAASKAVAGDSDRWDKLLSMIDSIGEAGKTSQVRARARQLAEWLEHEVPNRLSPSSSSNLTPVRRARTPASPMTMSRKEVIEALTEDLASAPQTIYAPVRESAR